VVALAADDVVDPTILVYLNRLSDFLFVAARRENLLAGTPERPWQP
jgi:cob(I)alamin adenosyltransferase